MELKLVHLYPDLLNIYGDFGNIAALSYRCRKRGIKLKILNVSLNQPLNPGSFDLLFAGGGQDSQQQRVSRDLPRKAAVIIRSAKAGLPLLTICGAYQLFGRYFQPFSGPRLPGIGLFPAYTVASKTRKIGNILINLKSKISDLRSSLVGFENHSGNTFLDDNRLALGKVLLGSGNNGLDQTEGCRIFNAIGCYLHGSLLPKNPHLADWLITTALEKKYAKKIKLRPLDDTLEWQAHNLATENLKLLRNF